MGTLGRVTVLVTIALIVGAGLCLFDTDHGVGGELCGSFLVATIGLRAPTPLTLAGRRSLAPAPTYDLDPLDLSAPPPKV